MEIFLRIKFVAIEICSEVLGKTDGGYYLQGMSLFKNTTELEILQNLPHFLVQIFYSD